MSVGIREVYENQNVIVQVVESPQRTIEVMAPNKRSGFRVRFPTGMTVCFAQTRGLLIFRYKRPDKSMLTVTISEKQITDVSVVEARVIKFIRAVFVAVPVLYDGIMEQSFGSLLQRSNGIPFSALSENTWFVYNPIAKRNEYVGLASDASTHKKLIARSADIVKEIEVYSVSESQILTSHHSWSN